MNVVFVIVLALLAAAAALTLVRLVRGPGLLDRIVALDVTVVLIVAGIAVGIAVLDEPRAVPLLTVIALLGFVGTITAAHLVEEREDMW